MKTWDPAAVRLAVHANHYRSSWDWTDELVPAAAARLERWRAGGDGDAALEDVRAALDADLDTPRAIAAIDAAVATGRGVSKAAALLGVTL